MSNSSHLQRWVRMISGQDLTILIFPVLQLRGRYRAVFPEISLEGASEDLPPGVFVLSTDEVRSANAAAIDLKWHYAPKTHHFVDLDALASADQLATAVARFKPHLLHSMETQLAGYLVAECVRRAGKAFPWIHSTWGSDLALYSLLRGHEPRLRKVFRQIDLHLADCPRDHALAQRYGYSGPTVPTIPSSGGVNIGELSRWAIQKPSARRRLVIKGYHNWAGRNLLALSALKLIESELDGYEIIILNADPSLREWAGILSNRTSLKVQAIARTDDELDVVKVLADARAQISLSISDGLPTMVLEAMSVGAFPIQSRAGCASDLFEHGVGGFAVPVNNTRAIADAISRVIRDDALVDSAADRNLSVVRRVWDQTTNRERALAIYAQAIGGRP